MKSAFASIWSSVIPISFNSSKIGRHDGSARSIPELVGLLVTGLYAFTGLYALPVPYVCWGIC
jgi:hypothetical protein